MRPRTSTRSPTPTTRARAAEPDGDITADDWEGLRTLYARARPASWRPRCPGSTRAGPLRRPPRRPRRVRDVRRGLRDPARAGARRPRRARSHLAGHCGDGADRAGRAGLPALARPPLRGADRAPRLPPVLRRVQGHGDGLLRAPAHLDAFRELVRDDRRRRLRHRAPGGPLARAAVRCATARVAAGARRPRRQRPAPPGGGAARPRPLAARAHRARPPGAGRRRRAQLRGQLAHLARGAVRGGLGAARRRRRGHRARRRARTSPPSSATSRADADGRLGRGWDDDELAARGSRPPRSPTSAADVADAVAEALAADGSSPGSRAAASTGRARSATAACSPTRATPANLERLNDVKGREQFRPVAPMVLPSGRPRSSTAGRCRARTCSSRTGVRPDGASGSRPSCTSTARRGSRRSTAATEPLVARMLERFERRTGRPVVVNTSLNTAGRPMVDDPRDALECFGSAPIDLLAIGPFVVRAPGPGRRAERAVERAARLRRRHPDRRAARRCAHCSPRSRRAAARARDRRRRPAGRGAARRSARSPDGARSCCAGGARARRGAQRRLARGPRPWVAFLDDDVVCRPGWRAPARRRPRAAGRRRAAPGPDRGAAARPAGARPTGSATSPASRRARWATADLAYRRSRWPRSAASTSASRAPTARTPTSRCACGRRLAARPRRARSCIRSAGRRGSASQAGGQRRRRPDARPARARLARARRGAAGAAARHAATAAGAAAAGRRCRGRAGPRAAAGRRGLAATAELAARGSRPGRARATRWRRCSPPAPRCRRAPPGAVAAGSPRCARRRPARPAPPPWTRCSSTATARSSSTSPTTATPSAWRRCRGARRAGPPARAGRPARRSSPTRAASPAGCSPREQVDAVNARVEELLGPIGPWPCARTAPATAAPAASRRPGWCSRGRARSASTGRLRVVIGDIGADVEAARAGRRAGVLVPTPTHPARGGRRGPEVARDLGDGRRPRAGGGAHDATSSSRAATTTATSCSPARRSARLAAGADRVTLLCGPRGRRPPSCCPASTR